MIGRPGDLVGPAAAGTFGEGRWPTTLEAASTSEERPTEIELVPDPRRELPTVVALLSGDCLGCRPFWDDLAEGSSVLAGRANVVVVVERPLRSTATVGAAGGPDLEAVPVVVAPGFAERLGVALRPAFYVVPDGDPTHAWLGPALTPAELAAVVAQVGHRARAGTEAAPLAAGTAVARSPGSHEVAVGEHLVLHAPDRLAALALDEPTSAVWQALGSSSTTVGGVVAAVVAACRVVASEAVVVEHDVEAVLSLLARGGWVSIDGAAPPSGGADRAAAPGPCCGRAERDWPASFERVSVVVGGVARSVHVDEPAVAAELRARFADPRPIGDDEAVDLVLELRGIDGPTLWLGGSALVRHPDPALVLAALDGELAASAAPPPGCWTADASAWVGSAGAVVWLGRRLLARQPMADLARRGLRPVLGPVLLDPGRAEVVVVDGPVGRRGAAAGAAAAGRHPLVRWYAPGPDGALDLPSAFVALSRHLRPPAGLGPAAAGASLALLAALGCGRTSFGDELAAVEHTSEKPGNASRPREGAVGARHALASPGPSHPSTIGMHE